MEKIITNQRTIKFLLAFHRITRSSQTFCISFSLKINFVVSNSADPDKMTHSVVIHSLALHCLPKYPFWGFWSSKLGLICSVQFMKF